SPSSRRRSRASRSRSRPWSFSRWSSSAWPASPCWASRRWRPRSSRSSAGCSWAPSAPRPSTASSASPSAFSSATPLLTSSVSYGLEKQISRTPELFGTGHAGGLVASESSVNGSTGGAMIHLLTLGIPGSAATAVMMGAFLLHGIQPGPLLFTRQTAEVYTIVAGMILANVVMIGLGFLAALSFAMLMKVPPPILNTFIVVFCFLGAFALRNDLADVWLTMLFGVLGFFMRRYD